MDYLVDITSPLIFDNNDFEFKDVLDINYELADIGSRDYIFKILEKGLTLDSKLVCII